MVVDTPVSRPVSYIVKRGDTFAGILSELGAVECAAHTYYRYLVDVGLRALFPGDSIVVELCDSGRVRGVSLLSRLRCWYRLSDEDGRVRAGCYPLETSRYVCVAKGVLTRSLSEDMYDAGEGDALVAKLTEIFAWDINFFTDPRVGDRFEVVFEKRYSGGHFSGYGEVLAARYHNQQQVYAAYGLRDDQDQMCYYNDSGLAVQKQFLKAPLRYTRISSGYSLRRRHPILGTYRPHRGVDYAAPRGTPVYASADGVVIFAGRQGGYGNLVKMRHGASYVTYYGHLHAINSGVRKGARLRQGDMIGTVGSTGLSTGPHLDYRMRIDSRFVNPLTVEMPSGEAVSEEQRPRFAYHRNLYAMMLDGRFDGEVGSWVLEVETTTPDPVERVSRSEEVTASDSSAAGS